MTRSITSVDFKEIKAIEIRCKCGSVMSIPVPTTRNELPHHFVCVGCNTSLWYADEEGGPFRAVNSLFRSLSMWAEVKVAPFSLGFSLDASGRASSEKGN